MAVQPHRMFLGPLFVREIDNGVYTLFGEVCPTEVMAAYERLHAGVQVQRNGDRLLSWVVTTALVEGNIDFGIQLMEAMEVLGWRRSGAR